MDRIGRYRIIGELGRGAMGVVYHAIDPSIGRPVAIKTIRIRDIDDTQQSDKLRERLFREARSAGVLSHPNIVTIYDMDEVDGLAYIAMAYVNGPTLEKILAAEGALSGAKMMRILRQVAAALDYAHGRGIVHRDIKPANIMTDEDGAAKVTDFGIAKITAGANMTETRTVVGTPNYMSPEQVQGFEVDGRSDQFSMAVIAYEILTGERPFTGEHLSTVVFRIVAEEPAEAHRLNGTLTPQIDEVLRRGLAKKPEDRFPNCSTFVGALEMACAESRGWTTLPAGSSAVMPTVAVDRPAQLTEGEPARAAVPPMPAPRETIERKEPSKLFPVLMSVIVVLGLVGVFSWQAGGIPGVISFNANRSVVNDQKANEARPPEVLPPEPSPAEPQPATAPPDAAARPPANQEPQPAPAVQKPSPLGSQASERSSELRETVKIPASGRLQDVWATSNPLGAKVVLDDNLSTACQTPCMLHTTTGVHHLTYSLAGYQNEYREIHVGAAAMDAPLISLRQPGGTLMLTTNPPGASIRINGQTVPEVTPAQITLRPGSYSVTVEKGGKSQTQTIEIHESPVYLRIPLAQ